MSPRNQADTRITQMELTIDQALQQGIAAHTEGKLQDAERLYRAILQAQPKHPDANHNLGVLAVSVGKPLNALPFFRSALKTNPQVEQFWLSYSDALIQTAHFDEAEQVIADGLAAGISAKKLAVLNEKLQQQRSVAEKYVGGGLLLPETIQTIAESDKVGEVGAFSVPEPSQHQRASLVAYYKAGHYEELESLAKMLTQKFPQDPMGWKALGVALQQAGQRSEALAAMKKCVELTPQDAEAHNNLGVALLEARLIHEAEASFKKAIEADMNYADPHYNLGLAFQKLKRLGEAESSYRRAILLKPNYAEALGNLGNTLKDLGRLNEAEDAYRKAIEHEPDYAEAHGNLGNILKDSGKLTEAEASYKKAIASQPDLAEVHSNLGNTFNEMGRLEAAEKCYRRAIMLKPELAEAHSNLASNLRDSGRLEEAEASYKKAINLNPELVEAHYNLGNTLLKLGRLQEAEAAYIDAIALRPGYADVLSNMGSLLNDQGRLKEAEACLVRAISLKPDLAEAHSNLGNTLKELNRLSDAELAYSKAITINPQLAEAHSNLGTVLEELDRLEEAEASYRQALFLRPDYPEAHFNLGNLFRGDGKLNNAEFAYRKAIALAPKYAEAHNNLGTTLSELGRVQESEASYINALSVRPDYTQVYSNLLMLIGSMQFQPDLYKQYAEKFSNVVRESVGLRYTSWQTSNATKHLRVGFVSGDLRSHPVGYFIEALLKALQSSHLELYAYPTVDKSDCVTQRLQYLFDAWRPLEHLSDEEAARKIHDDGIQILIDLSGHTAANRLPVFAWKPAPIQVTWLGYFASTGLQDMDYIIGDPFVTPTNEEEDFLEKVYQLPESYLCFTPPNSDLKVSALPALSNGFVTFGCFNKLARVTDEVVSVFARILLAVPQSKIFLKDHQLAHEDNRSRISFKFAAYGISANRLVFEGRENRDQYLACYNRVDIALSPFPYGGGTTTVEGLWMGVPCVTRVGSYFLSHIGESVAHNSGLSDWVAIDNDDYVAKAVSFSSDLESLAALRSGLREQIVASPLLNATKFAEHFTRALLSMSKSLTQTD